MLAAGGREDRTHAILPYVLLIEFASARQSVHVAPAAANAVNRPTLSSIGGNIDSAHVGADLHKRRPQKRTTS